MGAFLSLISYDVRDLDKKKVICRITAVSPPCCHWWNFKITPEFTSEDFERRTPFRRTKNYKYWREKATLPGGRWINTCERISKPRNNVGSWTCSRCPMYRFCLSCNKIRKDYIVDLCKNERATKSPVSGVGLMTPSGVANQRIWLFWSPTTCLFPGPIASWLAHTKARPQ